MTRNRWRTKQPSAADAARKRKYNTQAHRRARRDMAALVAAGYAHCWRCGQPIHPTDEWHVGHDDDGAQIMGPEHARTCNLKAAARKGALIANAGRKAKRLEATFVRPTR